MRVARNLLAATQAGSDFQVRRLSGWDVHGSGILPSCTFTAPACLPCGDMVADRENGCWNQSAEAEQRTCESGMELMPRSFGFGENRRRGAV